MINSIIILQKLICSTVVNQWQLPPLDFNIQFPLAEFKSSAVPRTVTNSKECMVFVNPRLCLQRERVVFENRLKSNT